MKTRLVSSVLAGAFLFAISDIWAAEEVAFVNGAQVGNQSQGPVNLGLEFTVLAPIFVNEIGAFDSGGGGFADLASGSSIQVVIFNSATRAQVPGTLATFTTADPGVLTGGSRFKDFSLHRK